MTPMAKCESSPTIHPFSVSGTSIGRGNSRATQGTKYNISRAAFQWTCEPLRSVYDKSLPDRLQNDRCMYVPEKWYRHHTPEFQPAI